MLSMLFAAYVIGIVVSMPPGSVTLAGGRRAISYGFQPALIFGAGATTADFFYATLVYLGLSPLLEESEVLRLGMWLIGGAWLCWLGWEAIRTPIRLPSSDEPLLPEPRWRSYTSGVGITLLNPLTIAAWVALAGNFFTHWDATWPDIDRFGFLAILLMLCGALTWFGGLMWILSRLRHFISPRILRGVSVSAGVLLILFGLSGWRSALMLLL